MIGFETFKHPEEKTFGYSEFAKSKEEIIFDTRNVITGFFGYNGWVMDKLGFYVREYYD